MPPEGVHRSTYYRWKRQVDRWGLEAFNVRERRRPRMPNSSSPCSPLAALALLDAGQIVPAVILATLAIANTALLTLLDQWDR